jgi:acetoin utilization deacetylase AcuC-like enzyme
VHKLGIVKDERFLDHLTADGHPETHRRLEVIYAMLDQVVLHEQLHLIPPRLANRDELLWVHSRPYVDQIASTDGQVSTSLTPDTFASANSYRTARLAVGGLLETIARVNERHFQSAFALIRPPGHHAERSRALGYCLFNNVAIGAHFARRVLALDRILIVDWDVHHGNGTQHLFETNRSVLFFSIHQYPHFPGTGFFTEIGIGNGEGFTVNVPLPKGYGDREYVAIFERLLRPIALEFAPDLILVSAGFDTHHGDPLGGMKVTPQGFAAMTRALMNLAADCCDHRLVLVLEGGYDLTSLGDSVKAVLLELCDITICAVTDLVEQADRKKVDYAMVRSQRVHQPYWKSLRKRG